MPCYSGRFRYAFTAAIACSGDLATVKAYPYLLAWYSNRFWSGERCPLADLNSMKSPWYCPEGHGRKTSGVPALSPVRFSFIACPMETLAPFGMANM